MSATSCPPDPEFVDFLGGNLAPERAREIAAHLAGCEDCRHWMAGMNASKSGREASRKRFRFWIWISALLGVAFVAVVVLVVLAGQKIEKLSKERGVGSVLSGALFQILPDRAVAPGAVFPMYSRRERVILDRTATSPALLFYCVIPGSGMQRLDLDRSGALTPPGQRGLVFYLAIEFPASATTQNLGEFEKSAEELARRSPPMNFMGNLSAALTQRGWKHQMTPVEWGD